MLQKAKSVRKTFMLQKAKLSFCKMQKVFAKLSCCKKQNFQSAKLSCCKNQNFHSAKLSCYKNRLFPVCTFDCFKLRLLQIIFASVSTTLNFNCSKLRLPLHLRFFLFQIATVLNCYRFKFQLLVKLHFAISLQLF